MDQNLTAAFTMHIFAVARDNVTRATGPDGRRKYPPELETPAIRREMENLLDSVRHSEETALLLMGHATLKGDGLTLVGLIENVRSEAGRQRAVRIMASAPDAQRHNIIQDEKNRKFFSAIVKNIFTRWDPLSPTVGELVREWAMDWRDPEASAEVSRYFGGRCIPPPQQIVAQTLHEERGLLRGKETKKNY